MQHVTIHIQPMNREDDAEGGEEEEKRAGAGAAARMMGHDDKVAEDGVVPTSSPAARTRADLRPGSEVASSDVTSSVRGTFSRVPHPIQPLGVHPNGGMAVCEQVCG